MATLKVNLEIVVFFLLLSATVKSQSNLLSQEISYVKTQALSIGFELVREDTLFSDLDTRITIPSDVFEQGKIYYWVVFADSCIDCEIQMLYSNLNSSKSQQLEGVTKESKTIKRLEYSFRNKDKVNVKFETFIDGNTQKYLYSYLFKKKE